MEKSTFPRTAVERKTLAASLLIDDVTAQELREANKTGVNNASVTTQRMVEELEEIEAFEHQISELARGAMKGTLSRDEFADQIQAFNPNHELTPGTHEAVVAGVLCAPLSYRFLFNNTVFTLDNNHPEPISLVARGGQAIVLKCHGINNHSGAHETYAVKLYLREHSENRRIDVEHKLLKNLAEKDKSAGKTFLSVLSINQNPAGLVMPWIEGSDVDNFILQPRSLKDSLDLVIQLSQAIQEIHEAGITHRDLAPGNIRRTPNGEIFLLDFGYAKAFGSTLSKITPEHRDLTREQGDYHLTAGFVSPERVFINDAPDTGPEIDRYSVGLFLHLLLTGELPFGLSAHSDDYEENLQIHIRAFQNARENFPTSFLDNVHYLPDDVKQNLERLLLNYLQIDPTRRTINLPAAILILEDAVSMLDEEALNTTITTKNFYIEPTGVGNPEDFDISNEDSPEQSQAALAEQQESWGAKFKRWLGMVKL